VQSRDEDRVARAECIRENNRRLSYIQTARIRAAGNITFVLPRLYETIRCACRGNVCACYR